MTIEPFCYDYHQMSAKIGDLSFGVALENQHLIAKPVQKYLETLGSADEVLVAEIRPDFSDSLAFCEEYRISPEIGANCLIVEGVRGENKKYAACLVPINSRANINSIVRKQLDARRASMVSKVFAVSESGMEYGSITVVGLPKEWPILIDKSLVALPQVIIGAGLRKSKLLVSGKFLSELLGAVVIQGLAT